MHTKMKTFPKWLVLLRVCYCKSATRTVLTLVQGHVGQGMMQALLWAAVFASVVLGVSPASATVLMGGVVPEAANHYSIVRDSTGARVALDVDYAADIRAAYNGTFNVVMQQCFGGGFLNDIQAIAQPHTFTSASAWNEPAFNNESKALFSGAITRLANFTDAWRADANTYGAARSTYVTTLGGNPGTKDPYALPGRTVGGILGFGATTYLEHPQYESPDPGPVPGPNDTRALFTPGQGGNNYAILVAWAQPEPRHAVNIARVYDTLNRVYNVPFNNIVTLYGNTARNSTLGPYTGIKGDAFPGGENLGGVFVDGPNTRANWLSALAGNLFVNPNVPNTLGIQYGPNDRLFIYNTGHGGEAKLVPIPDQPGVNWVVNYANGFSLLPQLGETVGISDPDGTNLLQLSLRTLITDPAVHLTINGVDLGSLASALVTSASQTVYDLAGFVTDPTYTYQLRVQPALLATFPDNFYVNLIDPLSPGFVADPHLIAAIDLRGGDQELLTIYVVPEPSTIILISIGMAGLAVARLRKRKTASLYSTLLCVALPARAHAKSGVVNRTTL